ncbi:MAG: hypothetical protein LBF71_03760 [Campylobacteraceae bacterium]|jgi:hypothetical protein|nr:hypothetical protein [Campylobacteraceae bacterium]
MEVQKHSGLGVASFALSIISVVCIFVLFIVAGAIEVSTPGGMDENSAAAVIIGVLYFLFAGFSLVGVGLGIAGLFAKERKKIFAVLGLIFSAAIFIIAVAVMVIGLSMVDSAGYYY